MFGEQAGKVKAQTHHIAQDPHNTGLLNYMNQSFSSMAACLVAMENVVLTGTALHMFLL